MAASRDIPTTMLDMLVIEEAITTPEDPIVVTLERPLRWDRNWNITCDGTYISEIFDHCSDGIARTSRAVRPKWRVDGDNIVAGIGSLLLHGLDGLWYDLKLSMLSTPIMTGEMLELMAIGPNENRSEAPPTIVIYTTSDVATLKAYIIRMMFGGTITCGAIVDRHAFTINLGEFYLRLIPIDASSLMPGTTGTSSEDASLRMIDYILQHTAIDSNAICTNGSTIWTTPRCLSAWHSRINVFKPSLMTRSFETEAVQSFYTGHDMVILPPYHLSTYDIEARLPTRKSSGVMRLESSALSAHQMDVRDGSDQHARDGGLILFYDPIISIGTFELSLSENDEAIAAAYYDDIYGGIIEGIDLTFGSFLRYMRAEMIRYGNASACALPRYPDSPNRNACYDATIYLIENGRYNAAIASCITSVHRSHFYSATLILPIATMEEVVSMLTSVRMLTLAQMCEQSLDCVFERITPLDSARWNNWFCRRR